MVILLAAFFWFGIENLDRVHVGEGKQFIVVEAKYHHDRLCPFFGSKHNWIPAHPIQHLLWNYFIDSNSVTHNFTNCSYFSLNNYVATLCNFSNDITLGIIL